MQNSQNQGFIYYFRARKIFYAAVLGFIFCHVSPRFMHICKFMHCIFIHFMHIDFRKNLWYNIEYVI